MTTMPIAQYRIAVEAPTESTKIKISSHFFRAAVAEMVSVFYFYQFPCFALLWISKVGGF
jgi:hypothetical protein